MKRTDHTRLAKEIKGYIGSFGGMICRYKTVGEMIGELKKHDSNAFVFGYEGEDTGLSVCNENGQPIDFISTKVEVRKWTKKDLTEE